MQIIETFTATFNTASVTLKAWLSVPSPEEPDLLASSLRVDVTQATNFPQDIFTWERQEVMLDSGGMQNVVRPVCVAKPSDLSVYPAKSPAAAADCKPPFYRDNFLSFQIESPDIVMDTWQKIKQDVQALLKTVMKLGGPPA